MFPEVSVIVATRRRPLELVEAVESALAQDVSLEVLVVDDSPDRSAREPIASIRDPRVRYEPMPVPSNGMPSRVRNYGLPRTLGPLVHFLDDDDRVPPGAYRKMRRVLLGGEGGVAFGRVVPFGDDADEVELERTRFEGAYRRARLANAVGSKRLMAANVLFLHSFLVTSACMMRRDCLDAVGGFDADLAVFEDVDLCARAMRRFGGVFIDEVVLHYRVAAGSLMRSEDERAPFDRAYQHLQSSYRRAFGGAELFALKFLGRGLLRAAYGEWKKG